MIDIHCHILPEVDDGPKSWDVAVEMCRVAAADGTTHIVATPHANNKYHYDREYLSGLLDQLRQRVGTSPTLSLGCDFHMSYENIQDVLARPEWYQIEGSQYLLVELSNYSVPQQIDESFTRLGDRGIVPIVTHPERNPILQQTPQRVLAWAEQGCAIQLTSSVFTGQWGERAQKVAKWLLEHDAVHILASDGHDLKHRMPVLSEARDAVAKIVGGEVARALVEDNPAAVVHGKPLPYFPDPILGK